MSSVEQDVPQADIRDAGLLCSFSTQAYEGKVVMSDKTVPITGGCMCGTVRYEAKGQPVLVEFCHCRSCRHAVGAPLMAWAAFRRSEFAITAGNPTAYESSPGMVRTFCGRCGTSLTGLDARVPDEIYVSLGSFDDAEELPPRGPYLALAPPIVA